MPEETGNQSPITIAIGKEFDQAVGEVLRELLRPSARELGGLMGDAIGLLSDKMRIRRQVNAERGLEVTREKLAAKNIDLDATASPPIEDVHLIMNGMTLSQDDIINDLWGGLFADALDPASSDGDRRAIIKTLETLSRMDASIIAFIAFTQITIAQGEKSFKRATPKDYSNITVEENQEIEIARNFNIDLQENAAKSVLSKAQELQVTNLQVGWSENLLRLGVIERQLPQAQRMISPQRLDLSDLRGLQRAVANMHGRMEQVDTSSRQRLKEPSSIFENEKQAPLVLTYKFTLFGERLAKACGVLTDT